MQKITLTLETVRTLLAAADSYHDDICSGVEDGTYEAEENDAMLRDLPVAIAEATAAIGVR